jgi:hypothetical protein
VAKRKKIRKKKGQVKRWGENPVPVSGAGPNANVVAEYKERAASLARSWEGDHGPPVRVREEWVGHVKARGIEDWFKIATEIPGVWHYFHAGKHFLVKHFARTNTYKRSQEFTNKQAMLLYLHLNRIRFDQEFNP